MPITATFQILILEEILKLQKNSFVQITAQFLVLFHHLLIAVLPRPMNLPKNLPPYAHHPYRTTCTQENSKDERKGNKNERYSTKRDE